MSSFDKNKNNRLKHVNVLTLRYTALWIKYYSININTNLITLASPRIILKNISQQFLFLTFYHKKIFRLFEKCLKKYHSLNTDTIHKTTRIQNKGTFSILEKHFMRIIIFLRISKCNTFTEALELTDWIIRVHFWTVSAKIGSWCAIVLINQYKIRSRFNIFQNLF